MGTTYGGDGVTTFALPNLQSRIPIGLGQGAGLSNRIIGEVAGVETVLLAPNQIPIHTHAANCNTGAGNSTTPLNNNWAANANSGMPQYAAASNAPSMSAAAVANAGGNQPHENRMPFLAVNFIIALQGIFPSQN